MAAPGSSGLWLPGEQHALRSQVGMFSKSYGHWYPRYDAKWSTYHWFIVDFWNLECCELGSRHGLWYK